MIGEESFPVAQDHFLADGLFEVCTMDGTDKKLVRIGQVHDFRNWVA